MTEKKLKRYFLEFEFLKYVSDIVDKEGPACLRRPMKLLNGRFAKYWETITAEEKAERYNRFCEFVKTFGDEITD